MGKLLSMHPSDDQLELYLVGHSSAETERLVRKHSHSCSECLVRLDIVKEFILVFKTASTMRADHFTVLSGAGSFIRAKR
jgi:hypothetical protein